MNSRTLDLFAIIHVIIEREVVDAVAQKFGTQETPTTGPYAKAVDTQMRIKLIAHTTLSLGH